MAVLTVRKVPDNVHRALRRRAARHGRSAEAEVRAILESAVNPPDRVKLGSMMAAIGRRARLTDEDLAVFDQVRDPTLSDPVSFD